jgi:2-C-methyl-D-erythritol 2,4-cyclodiphosphate synthase
MINFRVGIGYDVHQLKDGLPLFLGGIEIPHYKGCVAHSDGDVMIHAICDALLGAANLRDIGYHFPDTDKTYENIDSKILLKKTYKLLQKNGYSIGNIDTVVCLQKPKLKDHIPAMQKIMSDILETNIDQISIKATTTEQLGFEGSEDGVSAQAIVLITKIQ